MAKLMMFEFRRQIFHLLFGLAIIALAWIGLLGIAEMWILFLVGLAVSIASRYYRIPVVAKLLDYFERQKHRRIFPGQGALFFVLGSFIVMALFERNVALASIIVLTIGDSVSHLAGRFMGRIPHPLNSSKFLEGAITGFAAAVLGAWIFVPFDFALIGAFVGMVAEGLDIKFGRSQIDDNLLIPLASGTAIALAQFITTLW